LCIAVHSERLSYYDTDRFVPVGKADHGPNAEFSSKKAHMSERSSHTQIMTREELLASFKNHRITTLEDLTVAAINLDRVEAFLDAIGVMVDTCTAYDYNPP